MALDARCAGQRREGARVAMAEAGLRTAGIEGAGPVTPAVVGQHAADLDAEMLVVGKCGGEKRGGAGGRLVGVDLGEGHAGMVVHADMDVFPAGAWTGMPAVVGDAVAGAAKPAEFLDIEVQQVAGMRVFVAADGRRRVEGGQSLESGAAGVAPTSPPRCTCLPRRSVAFSVAPGSSGWPQTACPQASTGVDVDDAFTKGWGIFR